MTIRSWARWLFARPATCPTYEIPARSCATAEALEDPAPPISTFQPAGAKATPHRGLSAPTEQTLGSLVHPGRFGPVTIGFWLGAAGMAVGGCLLGALMPYRHPVAVAMSVLWWGIYFGCFGAGVGAIVGVVADREPLLRLATWDGAETVPTELELDSRAADAGSTAVCAPRGPRGLPGHRRDRECPA
jgi:hypothetical protein